MAAANASDAKLEVKNRRNGQQEKKGNDRTVVG
jgi:hypothetical protein